MDTIEERAPEVETTVETPPQSPPQIEGPATLREAAKLVPVGPKGTAPSTFEHQITYAQYMSKATMSLPEHLRGSIGDCLAIIDIATHTGLSPYMLANKTYKTPNGRLAFESQLYHALLIQSGRLNDAALHVSYSGEGKQRKCKVWGTLRGENQPRELESQTLEDLHPGAVEKTVDGKKIEYAKGSPLWNDKPDVQMFYDTSRDWGRMFCPIATLGLIDAFEWREHPTGEIRVIEEPKQSLQDRLKGADRTEGHNNGHAEKELSNIAADKGGIAPADADAKETPAKKTQETKKTPAQTSGKGRGASRVTTAAADRAEKRAAETKKKHEAAQPKIPEPKAGQKTDDPPKPVPTTPKNAAEYQVYCLDWINKDADPEMVLARWSRESDMRDNLTVRIPMRNALRSRLEAKHGV